MAKDVTSRMGRVSRNFCDAFCTRIYLVTSRMGRVSRNLFTSNLMLHVKRHVPHGTCE